MKGTNKTKLQCTRVKLVQSMDSHFRADQSVQIQHTPSDLEVQAELTHEMVVLFSYQPLHEDVGKLVTGGHVGELDVSHSNLLAQKMVLQIDMLYPVMELWVLYDSNRRLVVDMKSGRGRHVYAEFVKELLKPDGLFSSMCNSYVLSFSR
jgi:hypothetical protein